MMKKFSREYATAAEAAIQAGKIVLEAQGKAAVKEKSLNNLVTEADLAAQEVIIKTIKQNFPDHLIIAEEGDLRAGSDGDNLWIIDPLDGTNNYAHNIPQFSISIAYARSGQVLTGVVYDPVRNEMFSAEHTGGAFLNNRPIKTSAAASLQEAIIATGFYYDRGDIMRKTLSSIEKLFEANIHGIRRFGSAALDLCWLACGRFDAYFEYKISIWDFAAGMLIVNEAGGKCSDQYGKPLSLKAGGLIVSNGNFHNDFLALVSLTKP